VSFRQISAVLSVTLLVLIIGVIGAVYYSVTPVVRRVEVQSREAILTDNLGRMRSAITKYAAERGQLPRTFDDLVNAKLLTTVPIDPITETRNWRVINGTRLDGLESAPGIVDVRSESSARSSKGTLYSEW
jgi:general secretion pathway protein G